MATLEVCWAVVGKGGQQSMGAGPWPSWGPCPKCTSYFQTLLKPAET